ncbi:threonine ammonia-lyase IlvA [Cellulophaga lytica]|uniref:L-threonine dehydratase n=1 Tax=Cellulophaga lytica (strain ATCC 23178 / DSM 7489 / JCM 8516 / NBRC 14961 / NCIMB 1423 / VKM B-1433 / Cy l20) TaxID=867900 RepID=F0RAZ0_CELLC|nr:threonine ammonia-lyase IlvA [Cellulophaga lytica]ADY30567.1 threonine dehydratase [Cellulophaga lytica DSM 7489]AIM61555.1 threonine dehydratase [Cellulophaga lytica]APU11447.1 threonine dehydratase [Cellulophaga lytica]MDO6853183.1 threonine ammonia-lyase IlvA [Cellulophaga lytica]WQG78505.1 threonine ammonia-lyase IlvA [Cellulophaga lytica]
MNYFPNIENIRKAAGTISAVADTTPLLDSIRYSKLYNANILLKREDLHRVRSYKIRGAFNKISSLSAQERQKGVVCASAGNHAQGVAFACNHLGIKGTIYMPSVTPKQKVEQTEMFGGDWVTIVLEGDTFDDSSKAALQFCEEHQKVFVHPFNDPKTIEGQATVGLEAIHQSKKTIDYIFVAIGGGGLAAGLCGVFKALSPTTKIIGVEPAGAPSMKTSIENGVNTELVQIDKFVDGAAVQRVGDLTFEICKDYLDAVITVPEGKVCQTILDLYNRDAIVVEPAGALTIAALDQYAKQIEGKNVVCVVSGSNNDITRTAEIKERALLFANLKHYFIVRFPQRPGALKEFVAEILGPTDDITHFEYSKKSSKENAPAVVGIELKKPEDLEPLIARMKENNFFGDYLNNKPDLFQYLV